MPAYSEDQLLLRDTVRSFVADKITPHIETLDAEDTFPAELIAELADLGLFGIPVSEDDGGAGLDLKTTALVVEELARGSAAIAWTLAAHTAYALRPLALYGNDEQKQRCLTDLAEGTRLGGLAAGEPHAGDWHSPHLKTQADGETVLLQGRKGLVTNGSQRGWLLVACREGEEEHVYLVDGQSSGVQAQPGRAKLGLRGADTVFVDFDITLSPADRLADASVLLARARDEGRILAAAVCLGLMEAALIESARYAQERRAFRKPIADFQEIQFKLADMKMAIDAVRGLVFRAVALAQADLPELPTAAASAKLFAAERALEVGKQAVQILGGNGYVSEYPVERMYRDAKVLELIGGPAFAHRSLLARACLAG